MQLYLALNGQQSGPFSEMQVREMLREGRVSAADLAWHAGIPQWLPLREVLGLEETPPPVPTTYALQTAPFLRPDFGGPMLAGRGTRLGAALLDSLLMMMLVVPGVVTTVFALAESSGHGRDPQFTPQVAFGLGLVAVGALVVLVIQCSMLATRGQTVGKRIVGVRIVTFADNRNPGFVKAVILRSFVPSLLRMVPTLGAFFGLVDVCFIFREDQRCIHDLLADTKVVVATKVVE